MACIACGAEATIKDGVIEKNCECDCGVKVEIMATAKGNGGVK